MPWGGSKVGSVPLASPLWARRHTGQTEKDLKRGAEDYQDCREGIGGELLQVFLLASAFLTPLYCKFIFVDFFKQQKSMF